jgi:hypothetical protein
MSSLFKQFQTDSKKEQEGVEVTYAPNDDGTIPTFIITRLGQSNQRYAKALETATAPYRRLIDIGALDKKRERTILVDVFCSSVLLGWRDVQDTEGKLIPFNYANAKMLFETLPELYLDLAEHAAKFTTFRAETRENDAKN